jgi:VanZ family protein
LILAIWTWALLSSGAPKLASALLPEGWTFYASKGLHFFAYASLGALVCWLDARRSLRVVAWLGLLGHGALTEFLQRFVEGRHGSLADVGLDAGSALVGLAAGLIWCCFRARPSPGEGLPGIAAGAR